MARVDRVLANANGNGVTTDMSTKLSGWRRSLPLALLCSLGWSANGAESIALMVRIVDESGAEIPARAWVTAAGRQLFQPQAPATCTPYARDQSFSCDGRFQMSVPAGPVRIHAERGKEWLPVDREITVGARANHEETVSLRRWVDLAAEGWFSADLHVHFGHDNPTVLRQLALADDVNLLPVFSLWLRGTEQEWRTAWPAWPEGETVTAGPRHLITRANLEIERIASREIPGGSVGATFLYQLRQPVSADRFDPRFPADTTLALAARAGSPEVVIDTDKPSWAENVVGAALGIYDTAQLCHNHYHRWKTLPGGWGMIDQLPGDTNSLAAPDELFQRTNQQYYRWLNCGIRMGVSGGSAMGVMPVPPGYSRVYAQVDGEFTAPAFWRAVKAGRTFATSGPLLELTVNGRPPGETIQRAGSTTEPMNIRLRLRSRELLEVIQLIYNGGIVFEDALGHRMANPTFEYRANVRTHPVRSGWYAARALFRAPDGRLRQAHTSPVYVVVEGRPIASRPDAEYNLAWVDRLIEIANLPGRYRSAADRSEVLAVYQQARAFYERTTAIAREAWGD